MNFRNTIWTLATVALLAIAPKMHAQTTATTDSIRIATQAEWSDDTRNNNIRQFLNEQQTLIQERRSNGERVDAMNKRGDDRYHPLANSDAEKVGIKSITPNAPTRDTMSTPVAEIETPLTKTLREQDVLRIYQKTPQELFEEHVERWWKVVDMTNYPPNHPKHKPTNGWSNESTLTPWDNLTPQKE